MPGRHRRRRLAGLVCPPDTDPVLDEPGTRRNAQISCRRPKLQAHVYPLGALTVGLKGEKLTEMAGADRCPLHRLFPCQRTHSRHRSPAACPAIRPNSFRYCPWLQPEDPFPGEKTAWRTPVASAAGLGLVGIPSIAETIQPACDIRTDARHRRTGTPVPSVHRKRYRPGTASQKRRLPPSPAMSASITCT